jgi:hypothetical protein
MGLVVIGLGLLVATVGKHRQRRRAPLPAGAIRPEFAAMGEIVRPMILFLIGLFAVKMAFFYAALGGERYLSPLDFGGLMFVLAAYAGWLVVATRRAAPATGSSAPARAMEEGESDPAAAPSR